MKVIVNKPVPAPVPPPTYDLMGLTEDEARLLYDILNCGPACASHPALQKYLNHPAKYGLWNALYNAGVGSTIR